MIRPIKRVVGVVVVAQEWPCWLPVLVCLGITVETVFAPRYYDTVFGDEVMHIPRWKTIFDFQMDVWPSAWDNYSVFASGSLEFCRVVVSKLGKHVGPFLYVIDMNFASMRSRTMSGVLSKFPPALQELGLESTEVAHAEFGGVTTARHIIAHRNVAGEVFVPLQPLHRTLSHVVKPTVTGLTIDAPPPLVAEVRRRVPIVEDGMLRGEGLLEVCWRNPLISCKCVLNRSGWARRLLTKEERLNAFDIPLGLCQKLREHGCERALVALEQGISPLVGQSVVRAMWAGGNWGGIEVIGIQSTSRVRRLSHGSPGESVGNVGSYGADSGEDSKMNGDCSSLTNSNCKTSLVSLPDSSAATTLVPETGGGHQVSNLSDKDLFVDLKKEHDQAKAVKSDDAEVPVHLWDVAVCRGQPTERQVSALDGLRTFFLRVYRRRLTSEIRRYMAKKFGVMKHSWEHCLGALASEDPTALPSSSTKRVWGEAHRRWRDMNVKGWLERGWVGKAGVLLVEVDALREIVWRAAWNEWFEYPAGSRLLYFRFPKRYRSQALEGVRVWYNGPGPSGKQPQPFMGPEEQAVLQRKITKLIDKGYLVPSVEDKRYRGNSREVRVHKSVIKYFAVPKGKMDDVVLDWRIVFDAGANELNDAVFVPSFSLPNTNSLLRLVHSKSRMADRDLSEMFHQFQLHEGTIDYTAIDLLPLQLDSQKYPHRWMSWKRNLMGFRSSPYNSVRMYLIIEEMIRGDRRDGSNPFQWESLMLNLPGTEAYNPSLPWVMQLRADNSMASGLTCFVDDQRVTGDEGTRVVEAGHAISTRESYVGLQDALRKLRHPEGSKRPGAWAGVNVVIEEDGSVAVTVTQEKWDRLKSICRHWLSELEAGRTNLDFKRLRSDRGFLVYVTQAYPGMKPYLKGFHLSLESWRGGRDAEGWKLSSERLDAEVEEFSEMDAVKLDLMTRAGSPEEEGDRNRGPLSGLTRAVPRFRDDLKALLKLSEGLEPAVRRVRGGECRTAVYGFGDASAAGFGATIERPGIGLYGRFGVWGKDSETESSNYRELNNLVETVEEEALEGRMDGGELWIFTDNSTAESVFHKGGSTSPKLHELVVRLRLAELDYGFTLYVVHVAGTRMIAQGTDGLSRGSFLEGVVAGGQMLSFIDLSLSATIRAPGVVDFVKSWVEPVLGGLKILSPEEWFVEGHGIVGGEKDARGVWIPTHAGGGNAYLWSPPPVIADVALEECLKAVHKRTDSFHIFVIPRLFTTRWMRLLYKLSDFVFHVQPGSHFWPSDMHEPLFVGISLPLLSRFPWTLRGTPLLVELEGHLCKVQGSGQGDGRDILQQLLRTPGVLARVPEGVACKVLRMSGDGAVSNEEGGR